MGSILYPRYRWVPVAIWGLPLGPRHQLLLLIPSLLSRGSDERRASLFAPSGTQCRGREWPLGGKERSVGRAGFLRGR
jgi:hypothetical protein